MIEHNCYVVEKRTHCGTVCSVSDDTEVVLLMVCIHALQNVPHGPFQLSQLGSPHWAWSVQDENGTLWLGRDLRGEKVDEMAITNQNLPHPRGVSDVKLEDNLFGNFPSYGFGVRWPSHQTQVSIQPYSRTFDFYWAIIIIVNVATIYCDFIGRRWRNVRDCLP